MDGQSKLSVLSQINTNKTYTVAEIAEELSKPSLTLPIQDVKIKVSVLKRVLSILKEILIFIIVRLPITLSIIVAIEAIRKYEYPVFESVIIALAIAVLLPSFLMLGISKTKAKWKRISRRILIVFCILSIPFSALIPSAIIIKSETTEINNYRRFDVDCNFRKHQVFQELFPDNPHFSDYVKQDNGLYELVDLDARNYYRYSKGLFGNTYDVYAEWPLPDEDSLNYTQEVERASAVISKKQMIIIPLPLPLPLPLPVSLLSLTKVTIIVLYFSKETFPLPRQQLIIITLCSRITIRHKLYAIFVAAVIADFGALISHTICSSIGRKILV